MCHLLLPVCHFQGRKRCAGTLIEIKENVFSFHRFFHFFASDLAEYSEQKWWPEEGQTWDETRSLYFVYIIIYIKQIDIVIYFSRPPQTFIHFSF